MDSTGLPQGGRVESFVFLGALFFFALIETFAPLAIARLSTPRRWLNHGILLAINTGLALLVFRGGAVVFSALVRSHGYGLLTHFEVPDPLSFLIGFAAVDLVHYGSHYTYHRIPFLWRIHRVHHADAEFDVTTGFRFHPMEALLTQGCNFVMIAVLAPPPLAVLAAETATLFQDIFEHANIELPSSLDRVLRLFINTPNMHRIHHSVLVEEQNRNFGTVLSWWDRLFGTYAPKSSGGLRETEVGLAGYPPKQSTSVLRTLAMPFEK